MKKIKTILFDLDGTLFHHVPSSVEVFMEHIQNLGLQVTEADRIRAEHWVHFYFAHSPEIQADGETFKDDSKGFWDNFTRRRLIASGIPEVQAVELAPRVSAYMSEAYKPETLVPEDARSLLKFLQESGYMLGMVSNREMPYREEMQKRSLDCYFQFFQFFNLCPRLLLADCLINMDVSHFWFFPLQGPQRLFSSWRLRQVPYFYFLHVRLMV